MKMLMLRSEGPHRMCDVVLEDIRPNPLIVECQEFQRKQRSTAKTFKGNVYKPKLEFPVDGLMEMKTQQY